MEIGDDQGLDDAGLDDAGLDDAEMGRQIAVPRHGGNAYRWWEEAVARMSGRPIARSQKLKCVLMLRKV